MVKNRYNGILKRYNKDIAALTANDTLKRVVAWYLQTCLWKWSTERVLELGCWEGEMTKHLLDMNKEILIDALDVSPSMIATIKKNLILHHERIQFLCKDIIAWLQDSQWYKYILESQVIHNFPQADKERVFQAIYDSLLPWGKMIITDKIYPNSLKNEKLRWANMLRHQQNRYDIGLSSWVAEAIYQHELQDFSDDYRMEEHATKDMLADIWFRDIDIIDRLERDVVLVAGKAT